MTLQRIFRHFPVEIEPKRLRTRWGERLLHERTLSSLQFTLKWNGVSGNVAEATFSPPTTQAMYPPTEKQLGVDEERTLLAEEALTGGYRNSLSIHPRGSDLEEVQIKPGNSLTSASRTAWQRFNGHGRRSIGFLQSLKAVILSSCAFVPIIVTFFEINFRK